MITNDNNNKPMVPGQQLAQAAAQKFGPGLGATPATGPVVQPTPPKVNPFGTNAPQRIGPGWTEPYVGNNLTPQQQQFNQQFYQNQNTTGIRKVQY
jgi:hypothetical protein